MPNKIIFIIVILICLILIYLFSNKKEYFDTNLFFQSIDNIFLNNNYDNNKLNKSKITHKTQSFKNITKNAYLYSKPTSQKIICASHKNIADCWEDNTNNCQWKYKINGNSYCEVGLPIWP